VAARNLTVTMTVVGFLVGVIAVLAVVFTYVERREHAVTPELARLHDYCATVRAAIEDDAAQLADATKPKRQAAAADRFGSLVTYHSEQEIALCSDVRIDLSERDGCWLAHNYACLAYFARQAADHVGATSP
jgi:hypothetical protein